MSPCPATFARTNRVALYIWVCLAYHPSLPSAEVFAQVAPKPPPRRWRVENGIAEAVKFFHLNALSSPIAIKVHFDIALTMIADTLYTMLAKKLRGFEDCDAPKLYRHFVSGKGIVEVQGKNVNIIYPKRAHNPILRQVPWENFPSQLLCLDGSRVVLNFS